MKTAVPLLLPRSTLWTCFSYDHSASAAIPSISLRFWSRVARILREPYLDSTIKQRVTTALDFARKGELWVKKWLTKPFYEIWQELNGRSVLPLITEEKSTYHSIQKVKTFTPPSSERAFVFAQLSKNIENACIKARKYQLAAKGAFVFLKTQQFRCHGLDVRFSRATSFPQEIIRAIEPAFAQLFRPGEAYRATGVVLLKLEEDTMVQLDLFGETLRA